MPILTLATIKHEALKMGGTVRKVDGEYQVKLAHWTWAHPAVYFTDCPSDALRTLRCMSQGVTRANIL
jgi:hypothetical protein